MVSIKFKSRASFLLVLYKLLAGLYASKGSIMRSFWTTMLSTEQARAIWGYLTLILSFNYSRERLFNLILLAFYFYFAVFVSLFVLLFSLFTFSLLETLSWVCKLKFLGIVSPLILLNIWKPWPPGDVASLSDFVEVLLFFCRVFDFFKVMLFLEEAPALDATLLMLHLESFELLFLFVKLLDLLRVKGACAGVSSWFNSLTGQAVMASLCLFTWEDFMNSL